MAEQTISSMASNAVQSVITSWQQLTQKACSNPELVTPGFGTKLEVWECDTGNFSTVSVGQEIELPKRSVGLIETTGAVPDQFAPSPDGLLYREYQPGNLVTLESVDYMCQLSKRNYTVWSKYFGKLATYRVVAADNAQTFWAFNAIMNEDQVKFPNGAEDSATYEVSLQPTGFFVYGELSTN